MERIGVRELRQHASRYLARVAGGESLEVTDRGRAVAHLVPVRTDLWDDLVASGRISLAEDAAYALRRYLRRHRDDGRVTGALSRVEVVRAVATYDERMVGVASGLGMPVERPGVI
ncbi:MAG: type II toxin-antitoxin system Phd/YefM family antitoxin [Acidimicrobiales bacterium]